MVWGRLRNGFPKWTRRNIFGVSDEFLGIEDELAGSEVFDQTWSSRAGFRGSYKYSGDAGKLKISELDEEQDGDLAVSYRPNARNWSKMFDRAPFFSEPELVLEEGGENEEPETVGARDYAEDHGLDYSGWTGKISASINYGGLGDVLDTVESYDQMIDDL